MRHPLVVLLTAIVLPGVGHVLNRLPTRGLTFVFYTVLLGVITWNLTTPDHSLVGRLAGGLFVYAISIVDAYQWAVHRARANALSGGTAGPGDT
ncbi:hypothetical protein SAMN05216207_1015146 [Pseudonocardia ammonioxydans]|uniref:Uncharacterized protein n=1 Tax=Pseudonocardia ammonioxydans TaxID=260086 RepID=A0A1I4ZMJ7_PSUAM|nr:hypothetical protein [Pseudonocardia ammonioxydans]SFN51417.1 hypothetical protein SAMN05216207_1015146 [Pseudonocardia ammonioxydans]